MRPALTPAERHAHHHDLIEQRVAAWHKAQAEERRVKLGRYRRIEASKRAHAALVGHLQIEHGARSVGLISNNDLLARHAAAHAADEAPV